MRHALGALAFLAACVTPAAAQTSDLNVTHDTTGNVSNATRAHLTAFTDAIGAKDNVRAGAALAALYASVIDDPRTGLRLDTTGLAERLGEDLAPFRTMPGTAEGGQWGFRVNADWLPAEDAFPMPATGADCERLLKKETDIVSGNFHNVYAAPGGPPTTVCGIRGDAPDSFWHFMTLQRGRDGGQQSIEIIFNSRSPGERDMIAPHLQRALLDIAGAVRVRS